MASNSTGAISSSPSSTTQLATITSPVPLTTTFTPAAHCSGFTFSSPSYYIWYNEPVVATSLTASDCYPSEFLDGYSSMVESLSQRSIAPLLGPIVCPKGWTTIPDVQSSTYVACCPSGFDGIAPPASVVHERPSYGGTCYSDFTSGQRLTVTEYNGQSLVEAKTLSQSSPGQVYAHVIDGMVQQEVLPTSTPATVDASLTTAPSSPEWTGEPTWGAASTDTPPISSSGLPNNTVKGIVIGSSIGGVSLIGLAIFFMLKKCKPNENARTRRGFEIEKDAVSAQIYEKDPFGDRGSSVSQMKTELTGPEVVHEICYELEGSPIQTTPKSFYGPQDPAGHSLKI